MGIVIFGAVFVDIKGYPLAKYIPGGRNIGRVIHTHGGVSRNVAEDIANIELRPTFVSVVDETGIGADIISRLRSHKVNTDYIVRRPEGTGTWLFLTIPGMSLHRYQAGRISARFWTYWISTVTVLSAKRTVLWWKLIWTRLC